MAAGTERRGGALSWTAFGAVSSPDAVQIRVSPSFPGRVSVGAPQPGRAMTAAEVDEQARGFLGGRGPRQRPVTTVIVSGLGASDAVLAPAPSWRARGMRRLVVHAAADGDTPAGLEHADERVWILGAGPLRREIAGDVAVIELRAAVIARLPEVIAAARDARPARIVLSWPFPGAVDAPVPATEVAGALVRGGFASAPDLTVKGLPPCVLHAAGAPAAAPQRTRNRWYVDADHLGDRALLFLPDLVRFVRPDSCRHCVFADRCDGVAEGWWAAGVVGPLRPLGAA